MRLATSCFAGMALLVCATGALALVPNPKAVSTPQQIHKEGSALSVPAPIHIDQGGDTIASALPIGSVPFADSGTTAGYVDNYLPTCGFAGGAPDVVYSLSPAAAGEYHIHLCGSSFDTEVYVYADVEGNVVGCNDDSCGLQSELAVTMAVGHTYYIIVDGYSNYSGAYQITVDPPLPPCVVTCPPGGLLEGEPTCGDNYYDSYNGGCNSVPPVFSALPFPGQGSPITVCGEYGGFFYAGLSYRDTDWYQVTVPTVCGTPVLTWTVRGETDTLCGIINGNSGCPISTFYAYAYGAKCTDLTASAAVSPGTWWLWAGTLNFGTVAGPCGQHYNGTLSSNCQIAVEPSTWGSIKNMYK